VINGDFFLIFGLGIFLGAVVRSLLIRGRSKQPEFAAAVLTSVFSRYNELCLILAAVCIVLQLLSSRSYALIAITAGLVLILGVKLSIDSVIRNRERSGELRSLGKEGGKLDILHR
jgi:hypothetical protein